MHKYTKYLINVFVGMNEKLLDSEEFLFDVVVLSQKDLEIDYEKRVLSLRRASASKFTLLDGINLVTFFQTFPQLLVNIGTDFI